MEGKLMNAGMGQKMNLYGWAKEQGYDKIAEFIEENGIYHKPMTQERYKSIRNAILFNQPATALKLLEPYGSEVI